MATLIRTDGSHEEVQPHDPKQGFQLEQLYKLLDCSMIQVIRLDMDYEIMIFDEEAKVRGDKAQVVNERATKLARGRRAIFPHDEIIGDALICLSKELK
jgi:hypothetical protein